MEEQTLYDELVNGLREIEKNVITDLNAGRSEEHTSELQSRE